MPTMPKPIEALDTQLSVDCTGLPPDLILKHWAEIEPLLLPALMNGDTIQHVLGSLMMRKAQLWIAATPKNIEAACVTEIYTRGGKKYCNLWLAGGRGVNNWLYYLKTIEAWAQEHGCDAMIVEAGRRGWQRLMTDYKIKTITLMKELKR